MGTTRTVTLEELGVVLSQFSANAPEALAMAVKVHAMDVLRRVVIDHMSGQDLGVVTGTARRSMVGLEGSGRNVPIGAFESEAQRRTRYNDARVVSEVGSPLRYVRAHEEGFAGAVGVRAHTRNTYGRSNALTKSGRRSTAMVVKSVSTVRAHQRHVMIKAKHFLRKSIVEAESKFPPRVKRALIVLTSTGRIPTFNEVARA